MWTNLKQIVFSGLFGIKMDSCFSNTSLNICSTSDVQDIYPKRSLVIFHCFICVIFVEKFIYVINKLIESKIPIGIVEIPQKLLTVIAHLIYCQQLCLCNSKRKHFKCIKHSTLLELQTQFAHLTVSPPPFPFVLIKTNVKIHHGSSSHDCHSRSKNIPHTTAH